MLLQENLSHKITVADVERFRLMLTNVPDAGITKVWNYLVQTPDTWHSAVDIAKGLGFEEQSRVSRQLTTIRRIGALRIKKADKSKEMLYQGLDSNQLTDVPDPDIKHVNFKKAYVKKIAPLREEEKFIPLSGLTAILQQVSDIVVTSDGIGGNLKNFSTMELLNELRNREDSP